ncbi:MAG: Na+/H+ antiporter NhaC [Bacteroidetes bacterium]|jgi:Na+:H+ antiporter, NhaC family|nr:Na+/H+ antiporter NhaC [Bacteroidota bacterium]
MTEKREREPGLIQSIIPIVVLIIFLALNVVLFGDESLEGPNQIVLLLAAGIAALIARKLGLNWKTTRAGMVKSIGSAMPSILILLLIGSLAGTWLLSGVVPALIYYGLKIINPTIFLFAAVIVSALVSVATGSSWSTIATLGVALLGVGKALGFHEGVVAGAIISGAYFGDKMSPLSDTTNLAPAMAGTDIFTHIKYMALTTGPTFIITMIIFLIWGFVYDFNETNTDIANVLSSIESTFTITPWLFLVPVLLIAIIMKKVPPLPALMAGTLLGVIFALIFQPDIVQQVAGDPANRLVGAYMGSLKAMAGTISIVTSEPAINDLLSTKGMAGMLNTIWLILSAMVFGGAMERSGMLKRISKAIISKAKSTAGLITATSGTCLFFNVTASDQYMAIVVPGRMFANVYKDRGVKPEVLSRTLEDTATVTSVLIPWNTCGATQAGVLGVSTFAYLPYAFFNIISPFMTLLYAWLNINIRKYKPDEKQEEIAE